MCINLSINILGQQQQRTVTTNPPSATGDINDEMTTIYLLKIITDTLNAIVALDLFNKPGAWDFQ